MADEEFSCLFRNGEQPLIMLPWHHRNHDSCLAFSFSYEALPHLLFIWDLSTRSLAIEEEGRGKGELLFHLAGRPPSLIRRPFWRKCHLIRVACEHSATPSNSDMWDRWKEKHPWIRGRLSSTLFFTVCGRRGAAMVNSCVAGAWTHSRTLNAIWSHPCTRRWTF